MIQGTKIFKVKVSNGEIDNHKASDYDTFPSGKTGEAELYQAKAKALVRFDKVAYALQKGLDTMAEIVTEGDDEKTVASSISFTLVYTQPDGLWVEDAEAVEGEDVEKLRDGRVIVKGKKAIEKLITDACKKSHQTVLEYWQPAINKDGSDKALSKNKPDSYGWAHEQIDIDETTPTITVEEVHELETEMSLIKD